MEDVIGGLSCMVKKGILLRNRLVKNKQGFLEPEERRHECQ